MQTYDGPIRRILRKTVSNTTLKIDGRVDHLEDRFVYVRQKLKVIQKHKTEIASLHIPTEWSMFEEKEEDQTTFKIIK